MPEIPVQAVYNPGSYHAGYRRNMDISSIIPFVGGLSYLSYTIYRANQDQIAGEWSGVLRWLLYGLVLVTFFYGLFILQVPFMQSSADIAMPQVDATTAGANFILTVFACLLGFGVISSAPVRDRIRRLLPATATYNPESPVHAAAIVLTLALICMVIGNFVIGGGISGLAESFENSGVSFREILLQQVLWIVVAALGVGLLLRRTPQQTMARLGLRFPTLQDFTWGTGVGLLLFGFVVALASVWALLVSPEEFQQQTAASGQLAQAFNSLPLALLTSLVVAFGEEIFFRGALQPVFGNVVTSVVFAALHTQYTLTPATIAIVITSLALGWLRSRYSTSTAIIGHFVYNFIQLAIAVLVSAALQNR